MSTGNSLKPSLSSVKPNVSRNSPVDGESPGIASKIPKNPENIPFVIDRPETEAISTIAIKLKEGTAFGRFAYENALSIGRRTAQYRKLGQSVPLWLKSLFFLADHLVLKNIRRLLGINDCRLLSTAAAPIAPELIDWFWSLGRPMYEVYGQTECTGIVTANAPGALCIGSVGKVVADAEVQLSTQ